MAPPPQGEDFMLLHRIIRFLAYLSSHSFFHEIRVIGEENVPKDGPIIVTATHHNMMLDPVILSVTFPHKRKLNYWSKAQLFKNPAVAWILYSSGNIPVDRKSKDRQRLFDGTFKALAKGNAVALFPEGTSYTEPRIMQVKDGAAWAALEYYKYKEAHPELADQPDVKIVPAAIVYTNKSKYRSSVVVEYGKPISAADFKEQFLSTEENAPRSAVKCLTRTLESELVESTINAPDWDTLYAARMAKDLLWEGDRSVGLDNFVPVSQTLVDLFSNPDIVPNFNSVRRHLLTYYSLLQSSHLTNGVLSSLPLPRSLDPNTPTTTPGRLFTLLILVRDSITALIGLPFFFLPLIVHLPVYMMGRMGARLVEDEEETQAQNKVALGLITSLLLYPAVFFFLWALFWYTPIGAILAGSLVYLFAFYHTKMIDGNYERSVGVSDSVLVNSFELSLQGETICRSVACACWRLDPETIRPFHGCSVSVHDTQDSSTQSLD
ncbi:glycerol-3-phosphate O-acyltransferase, variant 2 [Coprinopsis cinerea AmutBmut pab1-1]|nr:glycerol-3-phosphate O-acyltransferase, variant 2 [Coprinopsis cinerea AmutBmut pab1-1]